jgi:hypothetical protein
MNVWLIVEDPGNFGVEKRRYTGVSPKPKAFTSWEKAVNALKRDEGPEMTVEHLDEHTVEVTTRRRGDRHRPEQFRIVSVPVT